MYVYANLTKEREKNGKSQKDIAYILGITQQQYSLYESGKREIPIHLVKLLAHYYGVSMDYLTE